MFTFIVPPVSGPGFIIYFFIFLSISVSKSVFLTHCSASLSGCVSIDVLH